MSSLTIRPFDPRDRRLNPLPRKTAAHSRYRAQLPSTTGPRFFQSPCDGVYVQYHLCKSHLFFIDFRFDQVLNRTLCYVKDRKSQTLTGQYARVSRIALRYRDSVTSAAFFVWSPKDDDNLVSAKSFCNLENFLLTFQVNSAGGCSNKAVCQFEHHFSTGTLHTFSDCHSGHSVPLSDCYDLFPCQVNHLLAPSLLSILFNDH